MSNENVSFENLKILINGNLQSNMLSYAAEQALSGDQVMYCVAFTTAFCYNGTIQNPNKNKYVDFLNEIINRSIK